MAEPVSPNLLTDDQRARRQRIIDAGLVLLERNEYEHIQIKDVAEEADVALGTLYHYFSSKEHLFAEVLVKWAATLKSSLARHPAQGLTPREKLTERRVCVGVCASGQRYQRGKLSVAKPCERTAESRDYERKR